MEKIREIISAPCRVHFIGIGGAGMFPLAEILHARGFTVTGSDSGESETLERVRALGIPVAMPQRAENIGDTDLIVFTAALLPDNPELVAARASGIPVYERAKLLGALTEGYGNCIGVCGTHGKTTVTAMIAHILLKCGKEPGAVIGGKLPLTGTNGIAGSSDVMVVEACEFADTFLQITPTTAVILNIDADHMEYFKTMENLRRSFTRFAEMAQTVIYNADDENTRLAVAGLEGKKLLPFGLATVHKVAETQTPSGSGLSGSGRGDVPQGQGGAFAKNITLEKQLPRFTLVADHPAPTGHLSNGGEHRVKLNTPGVHNVHNALAALAVCYMAGCDLEKAIAALESFGGAGRRFEIMYRLAAGKPRFNVDTGKCDVPASEGSCEYITIADDYAHHPKELEVTLNAAMGMGYRRVWAIFQPFTFSRTALLLEDFARVLQIPDYTVLTEIKGSRELNTYGIHTSDLAAKIPGSVWFPSFEEIADYVAERVQPGDLVLTLGCGDPYKIGRLINAQLTIHSNNNNRRQA